MEKLSRSRLLCCLQPGRHRRIHGPPWDFYSLLHIYWSGCDIRFDPNSGQFLVAWIDATNAPNLYLNYATFDGASWSPAPTQIPVLADVTTPWVSIDPCSGTFIITWQAEDSTPYYVTYNNGVLGNPGPIPESVPASGPPVTSSFDPGANLFLVTWINENSITGSPILYYLCTTLTA